MAKEAKEIGSLKEIGGLKEIGKPQELGATPLAGELKELDGGPVELSGGLSELGQGVQGGTMARAGGNKKGANQIEFEPKALSESESSLDDKVLTSDNNKKYKIEKELGQGGEAVVYTAICDRKRYAVKIYRDGCDPHERNQDDFGNHDTSYKLIQDRLSTLFGKKKVVDVLDTGYANIGGSRLYFEVMPNYKEGTVDNAFEKAGKKSEEFVNIVKATISSIINNLHDIHKSGILHKDIKPENLFYADKAENLVVFGDFGISATLDAEGKANSPQFRSVIYAAPEIYTPGVKNEISGLSYYMLTTKSDWYAVGMVILYMWMGKEDFNKIFDKPENELVALKLNRRIPIPADMPEELKKLTQGLLIQEAEFRWGYEEIQRHFEGKDVPVENILFKIAYAPSKNKVARNKEDLAQYLLEDQEYGIEMLYGKKINSELKKAGFDDLDLRLSNICEKQYPKDKRAGLYSAALLLNPKIAYYDNNGKCHGTVMDMLNAKGSNLKDTITTRSNPVYLYQEVRRGKEFTDALYNKVVAASKDEYREELSVLYWALHEQQLIRAIFVQNSHEDKDWEKILCESPKDVVDALAKYVIVSDNTKKGICSLGFVEFLRAFDDEEAAQKVIALRKNKDLNYNALYRLIIQTISPASDINLKTDVNSDSYAMSDSGVGTVLNDCFNAYYSTFDGDSDKMFKEWYADYNPYFDDYQASFVWQVILSFRKGKYNSSFLHHYFLTKGDRFKEQDEWAAYCTDYNSDDNKNKCGPYDEAIALLKTVAGYSVYPMYLFSYSGEVLLQFKDLHKISNKEIADSITYNRFDAWLAVNFQENPDKDFSKQYSYEKETAKYLDAIGKYCPDNDEYERYNEALKELKQQRKKSSVLTRGLIIRILAIVFLLLPTLALTAVCAIGLIDHPVGDSMPFSYYMAFMPIVVAVVYAIINGWSELKYFFADLGCLLALAIWLGVSAVLSFLCKIILGKYLGFVFLAILLMTIFFICKKAFTPESNRKEIKQMQNATLEHTLVEPLYYAFGNDDQFISSLTANADYYTYDYKEDLKKKSKGLLKFIVPLIVLFTPITAISVPYEDGNLATKYPKIKTLVENTSAKIEKFLNETEEEAEAEEAEETKTEAAKSEAKPKASTKKAAEPAKAAEPKKETAKPAETKKAEPVKETEAAEPAEPEKPAEPAGPKLWERPVSELTPQELYDLALIYQKGNGVKKDATKAFEHMKMAAEAGLVAAFRPLGEMYHGGRGVTKDRDIAAQWYTKAAENGDEEAKELLNNM